MAARRFTAAAADNLAVRELDAEIAITEGKLGALRKARTVLAGAIAEADGRCDVGTGCSGAVWSRWCRVCGVIVRRCDGHGGLEAATEALNEHGGEHRARTARKG